MSTGPNIFLFQCLWEKSLLCGPGWPRSCSNPPASTFPISCHLTFACSSDIQQLAYYCGSPVLLSLLPAHWCYRCSAWLACGYWASKPGSWCLCTKRFIYWAIFPSQNRYRNCSKPLVLRLFHHKPYMLDMKPQDLMFTLLGIGVALDWSFLGTLWFLSHGMRLFVWGHSISEVCNVFVFNS